MDGEKKIVPVPPNQDTINILFKEDIHSEEAMDAWLNQSRPDLGGRSPQNGEEMSLSRVGKHLYEKVRPNSKIVSGFFSTIFRQLQANSCRNSELDEDFG